MAIPSEAEIREIGGRVAAAVRRAWKSLARKEEILVSDDCLLHSDGSVIEKRPDGILEATFVAYTNPDKDGCNVVYRWMLHEPIPLSPEEIGAFLAGALAGVEDQKRIEREMSPDRRFSLRLVETGADREETLGGRTFAVKDLDSLFVVYLPKDVANDKDRVEDAVHQWVQYAEKVQRMVLFAVDGETYRVEAIEVPNSMRRGA